MSKSHEDDGVSFKLFQNQVNRSENKQNTRYLDSHDGDEQSNRTTLKHYFGSEILDCVYELDECRSYKHLLIKNFDPASNESREAQAINAEASTIPSSQNVDYFFIESTSSKK